MQGETVSHYRILGELGRGGMGVVFLAEDTKLERRVALKFLPAEVSRDEEAKQRFVQEARAASSLDHPNVCTIYEIDESSDGRLFIAMAYYEGETLKQLLRRGRLPASEALEIAFQAAQGLRKAHEAGIVHRDIKPANLLLTRDGIVKILDFGVAKLTGLTGITRAGTTLGTGAYMAPEQIRGGETDGRADAWSLGVVLYEMLAGQSPFAGDQELAVMYSALHDAPRPLGEAAPGLAAEIADIVMRLLAREPSQRLDCAQLVRAITALGQRPADARIAATSMPAAPPRASPGGARASRVARWRVPLLAAAALPLAAAAYFLLQQAPPVTSALAILPFDTASAEPDLQYLGEGIRDGLVTRLSRFRGLKIKTRRTALASDEDVRAVGTLLEVGAIGTGRIVQRGDTLELVAELIDVADGSIIWSRQYNRQALGLLAIESEISAEIARGLRLPLTAVDEAEFVRAPTSNPAAHRLYLQGRYFWNRRTGEGLSMAIDLYERALALDPRYALAWAGLADAHLMRFGWGVAPVADVAPLIISSAERAIELDATLAEPHATLGYLKTLYEWDWDGAQREFLRAIELNGNYSTAHHWYALYLLTMGDMRAALDEIQLARESEPESPIINSEVGYFFAIAEQYEQALQELRNASVLDPAYPSTVWNQIRTYAALGREEEARAAARTLLSSPGADPVTLLYGSIPLPLIGLEEQAREIYESALEKSASQYVMPGLLGMLAAALGEHEAAFQHFERALDERSLVISWLRDPLLVGIREDPRYASVFERVGLKP